MNPQELPQSGKIAYVFIDFSNLWQAQKAKGRFFDYEKLVQFLKLRFKTDKIKVFFYTAYPAEGTRSYSLNDRHKFYTFLKKGLGFAVIKKELKRIRIVDEDQERIMEKGNMDVEITIDALHQMAKYDTAVFFTGDADFLALVSYLRNHGKGIEALLKPSIETFPRFFLQVSDVVGRDDRLNIGRQPAATGIEIQTFVGKAHVNALVNDFTKIGPVAQVPGPAINLVDNDAIGAALPQLAQHLHEQGPPALRGGNAFFKPFAHGKAVRRRVANDGVLLFL